MLISKDMLAGPNNDLMVDNWKVKHVQTNCNVCLTYPIPARGGQTCPTKPKMLNFG